MKIFNKIRTHGQPWRIDKERDEYFNFSTKIKKT
jgi:hypothetical protein